MAGASRTANSSQQTLPGTNPRVDPFPDFSTRAQDLGPLLSLKRKDHHDRCRRLDGLVRSLLCLASFAEGDAWPGCGVGRQAGRPARRDQDCAVVHLQSPRIGVGGRAAPARGQKHSGARSGTAFSSQCSPHVLYCGRDDPGLRRIEFCSAAVESQLAHTAGCPGVQSDGQRGSGTQTGRGASSEGRKAPADRAGGAY